MLVLTPQLIDSSVSSSYFVSTRLWAPSASTLVSPRLKFQPEPAAAATKGHPHSSVSLQYIDYSGRFNAYQQVLKSHCNCNSGTCSDFDSEGLETINIFSRMDTFTRHVPFAGPKGLQELRLIAIGLEAKMHTAATSQSDYLRKICMKMLRVERDYPLQSSGANTGQNPTDHKPEILPKIS
ncbi:hypothetical protein OROMI_028618 [Orobanche minor]